MLVPVLLLSIVILSAGRYLVYHQSIHPADAIIILSGGIGRIEEGSVMHQNGFASIILLSNAKEETSSYGDMLQTALALGISEKVVLTEDEAQSTYQNALLTLPIMQDNGFSSAIVVSSDFHMRRVKFIFDHVYKDSGINLTYVGSSESGYNATMWWTDKYSREMTFNEYIKMIGNAFGYNGPEAKSVLEEIKKWFK